jgi:acyl carrier protein
MYSSLEEQVREAIASHLQRPADDIELHLSLRRDLGLDNLSLVGIALALEETQYAEFPFALLQDVDTVADLVGLHVRLVSELGNTDGAVPATRRPFCHSHRQRLGHRDETGEPMTKSSIDLSEA